MWFYWLAAVAQTPSLDLILVLYGKADYLVAVRYVAVH